LCSNSYFSQVQRGRKCNSAWDSKCKTKNKIFTIMTTVMPSSSKKNIYFCLEIEKDFKSKSLKKYINHSEKLMHFVCICMRERDDSWKKKSNNILKAVFFLCRSEMWNNKRVFFLCCFIKEAQVISFRNWKLDEGGPVI
jgi:hypothetical protein